MAVSFKKNPHTWTNHCVNVCNHHNVTRFQESSVSAVTHNNNTININYTLTHINTHNGDMHTPENTQPVNGQEWRHAEMVLAGLGAHTDTAAVVWQFRQPSRFSCLLLLDDEFDAVSRSSSGPDDVIDGEAPAGSKSGLLGMPRTSVTSAGFITSMA